MEIIYGINNIKKFKRPVAALGVFDGVHKGHRLIIKAAVKKARQINGTSVVLTFHPHPQKEQSLYSLAHRLKLINELGADVCMIIKFNPAFAKISAADFIKNILIAKIGASFVYVGKNFRFGKSAAGGYSFLKKISKAYNFKVKAFGIIKTNRRIVSSTYVRKLIKQGDLATAKELLQRPVAVFGTVIKGISLARKLGFPTANIDPHHEVIPPSGVYVVKVILENSIFYGVCNIGVKPTLLAKPDELGGGPQKHIEVYIFDFSRNIYGKDLEIQFMRKIRDEVKFASITLLARQIQKDIDSSKKIVPPR